MLSSISWQHYLPLISSLTTAYYAVVISLYYKGEVISLFYKNPKTAESDPRPDSAILGIARDSETSVPADELQFSSETSELSNY